MAINDVYRAAAQMKLLDDSEQVNVFYWKQEGGNAPDQDVLTDIDNQLGVIWTTVQEDIVEGLSFIGAEVDNLTQGTKVGFASDYAGVLGTGGEVADPLPAQVTLLVLGITQKLRTQGRKYLPTYGEPSTLGGIWVPAVLTRADEFAVAYTSFFAGVSGNSYRAGVVSLSQGGVPGDFNGFINHKVVPIPRTQKSRYIGSGS